MDGQLVAQKDTRSVVRRDLVTAATMVDMWVKSRADLKVAKKVAKKVD